MSVPRFSLGLRRINEPLSSNKKVAALIDSPNQVLADEANWPTLHDFHEGEEETLITYQGWLLRRARKLGGSFAQAAGWRPEWGPPSTPQAQALQWLANWYPQPLPIGKSCPELHPEDDSRSDPPFIVAAQDFMPFDDDAYAALLLPVQHEYRTITLFLLATQRSTRIMLDGEWIDAGEVWKISGEVRVDEPFDQATTHVADHALRWWRSLAGYPIKRGRPKGSHDRTFSDAVDALVEYRVEHGDIAPTLNIFLQHFLPHIEEKSRKTTWRRLTQTWGWRWTELKHAVYGDNSR